jgi:hypothetical protein
MEHKLNKKMASGNSRSRARRLQDEIEPEGIMKRIVLRTAKGSLETGAPDANIALRSVLETTMEITSLIVFVAMVGVWALAYGVA